MEPLLLSSQKEIINHGNKLAPYVSFHGALPGYMPYVLLHWHVEAEINVALDENAIYQIGEETFRAKKGDIIFVAPNTLHSVYPVEDFKHISDTLIFHLDMLGYSINDQCTLAYLRPIYNGSLRPFSQISESHVAYAELRECMDGIFNCIREKDDHYELLMKERLYHYFYLLFKYNCFTEATPSKATAIHTDKIKKALQYIQDNYKEQITISKLANLCHFSNTHFMSFFKHSVGLSCVEYIIELRLRVAVDLLMTTDLSVADIAMESGFRNISNFNRKFKNYYSITPSEYRKQMT